MTDIPFTARELAQLAPCPLCRSRKDLYCERDSMNVDVVEAGVGTAFRLGCACDYAMEQDRGRDHRTEWYCCMADAMEDWNICIAGDLDSEGYWVSLMPKIT